MSGSTVPLSSEPALPNPAKNDPKSAKSYWGALAALSLTTTCFALASSIVIVALPAMAQTFHASFGQIQWLLIAYLLSTTTLIVSAGRLGDIVGRRKLLIAGLLLFIVASTVAGMVSTLWIVIAARAAQGLGGAVMVALSMALVGETVPPERTGTAIGFLATMSAVGTASGSPLGGMLTTAFGWRAVFLFNLPLCLTALVLVLIFVPPAQAAAPASQRNRFDLIGTLLLAVTLSAYAVSLTASGTLSAGFLLLAAAVAGAVLFLLWQARAPSPLIRLSAFRDLRFSVGLFDNVVIMMVANIVLFTGPFYLSQSLGYGEATTGLIMCIGPLTAVLVSLGVGRAVDRIGSAPVIVAGLVIATLGLGAAVIIEQTAGLASFLVGTVSFSTGYIMFVIANNTAIMSSAQQNHRGAVSGMLNLARNLGSITAAAAFGTFLAAAAGATDLTLASPTAMAGAARIAFGASAALLFVSLAVTLIAWRFSRPSQS